MNGEVEREEVSHRTPNGKDIHQDKPCSQKSPRARLYWQSDGDDKYLGPNTVIGPEFVVRASEPAKRLLLSLGKVCQRKKILIVLLNGRRLEVFCDPSSTTFNELFQVIVESEQLDNSVTLGLAALIDDDFIFPPPECKLTKVMVSPVKGKLPVALTLYLRFKLFLQSLRGTRSWKWKHMLYLQLRRSVLERQIRCERNEVRALAALALQAEFGDYLPEIHGTDYFLKDHYLPEGEDFLELSRLHKGRKGLDPGRAEEIFISHLMSSMEYGIHYLSAIMVSDTPLEVWVGVGHQGLLVSSKKIYGDFLIRKPQITFTWMSIKKLSYSKQFFTIFSNDKKYKFQLGSNKSFYLFRLAWLHHKFFTKLTNEYTSLQMLGEEFGDKKGSKTVLKSVLYMGEKKHEFSALRRATSLLSPDRAIFRGKTTKHCKTTRSESCRESKTLIDGTKSTTQESSGFCSLSSSTPVRNCGQIPKDGSIGSRGRRGVLMGTKAIYNSQADLLKSSSLELSSPPSPLPYVLNSSIKSVDDKYHINPHESISESLAEKFEKITFVNDRILTNVRLERNINGGLGLQVTEGKDGKVYIMSALEGGPAYKSGRINIGDQIHAVDGQNVLNIPYSDVLKLIHSKKNGVDLVLSQANRGQHIQPFQVSTYPFNTPETQGLDLLANILQKPIEQCYLNTIRFDTVSEADQMVTELLPLTYL